MNHKIKVFATTALLLTLTSCGTKRPEPEQKKSGSEFVDRTLNEIEPKAINMNLARGESRQIELELWPTIGDISSITFTTTDTSIASVTSDGKVTAGNKYGMAFITMKCGDFVRKVTVSVSDEATKDQTFDAIHYIQEQQAKPEFVDPQFLTIQENTYSFRTKDGSDVPEITNGYYEELQISVEDAYVHMYDAIDYETFTQGGIPTYSTAEWFIYVTESFDGFVCHVTNEGKRYMVVNCASYQPDRRFEALGAILDNIFVSGIGIFTGQLETCVGRSDLSLAESVVNYTGSDVPYKYFAHGDDGQFYFECSIFYDNVLNTPDDNRSNDIPTGVITDETQTLYQYWEGNYCRYMNVDIEYEYDYKGHSYYDYTRIERNYDITEREVVYPDFKGEGWTLVDSIYDL